MLAGLAMIATLSCQISNAVAQSGLSSGLGGGQQSSQSGTYPYPAANLPGQRARVALPQNQRQLNTPRVAQFQQPQIQIPAPAFQLQQPGLQSGLQPGLGQSNLFQSDPFQPNIGQPNFPQPNLAQPNLAQPRSTTRVVGPRCIYSAERVGKIQYRRNRQLR